MTNRLRLVAAAAALVAAAPLASNGTAHAEPDAPAATRTVITKAVEPRTGVFFAKGRVEPSYENRTAILQRKLKSAEKWGSWKQFKTDGDSRYRKRIAPLDRVGTVCYRVKIKASGGFETSYSERAVCIRTRRA
jgi:hypothetical protein